MIVIARVGLSAGHERVDRRRFFVPTLCARTILRSRVVEEVTALKCYLFAFAPCVGVIQADGIHFRDAALLSYHVLPVATAETSSGTARATGQAQNIFCREVLLVYVVEKRQQRQAARTVEPVHVPADHVAARIRLEVIPPSGIEFSEDALSHVGARNDVDRLVSLAVIDT